MAEAGLAVDIGGTKALVALVRGGVVGEPVRLSTSGVAAGDEIVDAVATAATELARDAAVSLSAAAIAVPGLLDRDAGVVVVAGNLPFRDYALGPELSRRLDIPARIEDDANCGLLGEATAGVARGHEDVGFLTLSTGIGMALMSGGALVVGGHGIAGEIGHMVVVPGGRPCGGCGGRGCLEAYASGTALAQIVQERVGGTWTGRDVVTAAAAGDVVCRDAVDDAMAQLVHATDVLRRLVDPSFLVVGGGLVGNDWYAGMVVDAVQQSAAAWVPMAVGRASLGDRSALVGAATLLGMPP